jgi:guanosine-3',5'-bis(diphosphate) 3'-pyrophosphohydrolase
MPETAAQELDPELELRNKEIKATILFATEAHLDEFREGGLPYITHPMAGLVLIADWGIRCSKIWKAILTHDVFESRPDISFEKLALVIGVPAAQVVQELTFIPDPLSDIPAHIQKQEYMRSFGKKSIDSLVCKVADRVCNTADWLSTKPDYAPKYWKKATPLFEALMTRHLEVIDTFGAPVFPRMRYTIDNMNQMLI